MKNRQCDYYQALAKEDYYARGGEPPGTWLGRGAEAIGLNGPVGAKELSALFLGFSPTREKLVQNAGKPNRQPGWDLCFSAPKSVSILWSQLNVYDQQKILRAHFEAVTATLDYIGENYAYSRVGKGGVDEVKVGLVVAAFEHSCSRALDPQIHTHALVMNLGIDALGVVRSIRSHPFFKNKMLGGAYYRCELAHQLQQRLGVDIERPLDRDGKPRAWFEVKGMQKSILSHFSKRRVAIEEELGSRGMESASAAAFAALATREAKTIVPPRGDLHMRWKAEGSKLGFQPPRLHSKSETLTPGETKRKYRQALSEAIRQITMSENYFSKAELTRRALEAAQGFNIPSATVAQAVANDLQHAPLFVSLGTRNGEGLWSTPEVLKLEKEFLASVEILRRRPFEGVSDKTLELALIKERGQGDSRFFLNQEQQAALRYIAKGNESIKVVSGFAGTGKTEVLSAAREVLEVNGYRVIGAALAAVAARELQEKTGIPSDTIRMRERQLFPNLEDGLKYHATQVGRAVLGKSTWSGPPLEFDKKTVLILDEAGMASTRDFSLLAKAIVDSGGSLIAVGDYKQLPAVGRGGCFEKLVEDLKGVRLTEVRRQTDVADRKAIKAVVEGRPEEALLHYSTKGQFYVGRTRDEATATLVADWLKSGGAEKPCDHRIFAGTRAEVAQFNELCQAARVRAGFVDATKSVEHDGQHFMAGDCVRFNLAARSRGIQKGDGGTVVATREGIFGTYVAVAPHKDADCFSSRMVETLQHHGIQLIHAAMGRATERVPPRHDIVVVPLKSLNPLAKCYQGLSLDYAMTTHLGQGQTVQNSYILLGGKMTDRELSYVQSSRHRDRMILYASELEVGKKITEHARRQRPLAENASNGQEDIPKYSALANQMAVSRAKKLASSMKEEPQLSM